MLPGTDDISPEGLFFPAEIFQEAAFTETGVPGAGLAELSEALQQLRRRVPFAVSISHSQGAQEAVRQRFGLSGVPAKDA